MPFDGGIIDVTPTRKTLHLEFIDSDGKVRTDSYDVPITATDAELNAFSAETGALSNASLWNVSVTNHFATGLPSKANADNLVNDSIKDNVVMLIKTLDNLAIDLFIPANNETLTMVPATENPDPALLVDWIAAAAAIWPNYEPISVRFSERRNKNRATKL